MTMTALIRFAALAAVARPRHAAAAGIAVVRNSNDDDRRISDTKTKREIKRVRAGKQPHHVVPAPTAVSWS